jgi:hypothetical protein
MPRKAQKLGDGHMEELRDSFGAYYLASNPDFEYVSYQQERMVPALEAVDSGDIPRLMLLIPPGHSKSQLVSIDFASWRMGRAPKKNLLGLSYSADLSKDFGRAVRNRLKSPLHAEVFPKSQLSLDSRSNVRFRTISGGNYFAVGFSGTVFGRRADGIIIDDPLKNQKEARSRSEERFKFYKGVVKSRLRPGGFIIACTTRLCVGDWVNRVLDDEGDVKEGGQWTVLKIPAEENGHYLWEEFYGRQYYDQAKKDSQSWAAIYMQDPSSGFAGPWYASSPLPRYTEVLKPGRLPAYMIVDPGLSKSRGADPTSVMVLCANPDKKLLLADWTLDHMDPDERTQEIIRLIKRWSIKRLVYEEYGLNADTFHLEKAFRKAGISIRPIPVGRRGARHNLSKDDRLRGLIIDFKDGKFIFPEKMPRRLLSGETVDLMEYFENEEYMLFCGEGSVLHDEGLDCLSRTHDPEMAITYPEAPGSETEEDDDYGTAKGNVGWEAVYTWLPLLCLGGWLMQGAL